MNENKKYSKKEKAEFKFVAFEGQAKEIIAILNRVADLFKNILRDEPIFKYSINRKKQAKDKKVPDQIEFEYIGLNFYIEFTLLPIQADDLNNIIGSIIYGVNRTQHFADCSFHDTNEKINPKIRCKNMRCDRSEDKPIIKFSVNQHGLIKSRGELEDEWWVDDKSKNKESLAKSKESLEELHYRTLVTIWNEALDWTNETILP